MSKSEFIDGFASSLPSYEIPGHVAPGGALLLSLFLFEFWLRKVPESCFREGVVLHTPLLTTLNFFSGVFEKSHEVVASILFLLCLGSLAYFLGHVIASLSSFLVSRVFDSKAHDYPYAEILAMSSTHPHELTQPFYRGLFFWFNFFLITRYLPFFLYGSSEAAELASSITWFAYASIGLLAFIMVVKPIASVEYQRRRNARWMKFVQLQIVRNVLKLYAWYLKNVFALPYVAIYKVLSHYAQREKAFDRCMINEYKRLFFETFDLDPDLVKSENYWFSYMYIRHHSPQMSATLNRLLRLYGLARNLSTSFFVAFLYGFLWLLINASTIKDWHPFQLQILLLIPLIFFLSAVLMLFRYYYLKIPQYNKLVYRSFVFLRKMSPSPVP